MRVKKKNYFILPQRLNILFHSLFHFVPLSLSITQLSSSPKTLSIFQALILSHRHSLNLPHSWLPARPSRPKPPIASPSLSSLIVTLSSSLIHRRLPDPTVPSHWSPHTHATDHLKPTPPTHPFCRPSSLTLCLFVIGDFFYFVCDWWFCLVWVEEKNWRFEFFIYLFFLLWTGGGGGGGGGVGGGCGCGCGW